MFLKKEEWQGTKFKIHVAQNILVLKYGAFIVAKLNICQCVQALANVFSESVCVSRFVNVFKNLLIQVY